MMLQRVWKQAKPARMGLLCGQQDLRKLLHTDDAPQDNEQGHERFDRISNYVRYPNHFPVTMTVKDFNAKYDGLPAKARETDDPVSLAGRITSIRSASKKLVFLDISNDGHDVQVLAEKKYFQGDDVANNDTEFEHVHESLRRGDIIGIHGFPGKSGKGELSIIPRGISVLSPCVLPIPNSKYGIKEPDIRFRQKYLDLLTNRGVRDIFATRAKVIRHIRRYLEDLDFIEVETPILCTSAGGAAAKPFTTESRALNTKLYLRIAPELYLKQLVIGGMDRVFEIGKVFRNEGVDQSHNPEFTMCEFYQAYADYNDLMATAEDMLSGLVKSLKNSYVVESSEHGAIDFTPPFKRISIVPGIEAAINDKLPSMLDPDLIAKLLDICHRHDVPCPAPHTAPRILDCLVGHFLEPQCTSPTFLIDHPVVLSPLAKAHRHNAELTERFELFVAGKELCNAYTELNDPDEQRLRFQAQGADRDLGDQEAHVKDEAFCTALEYGLPPTGGFGIGIDRLVMLLAGVPHIREVILFPTMKPDHHHNQS
ncbi:lysine-tRNA ligase [Aphanomyces astaci]|uniref:Lysine--tRNA ligase n=1 Tax=Aphanomyces astaci TaxID=112090 RepID=W4GBE2_APHAT|nr:lysine-tRNA ligase [Aphanomyces astaci]ETV76394.1 lysine-tRNA ligase [Aphanomyces astaci]|eukprot:XP_009833939.1 lysine-tRNA ligase [Aphanomyces astaci]